MPEHPLRKIAATAQRAYEKVCFHLIFYGALSRKVTHKLTICKKNIVPGAGDESPLAETCGSSPAWTEFPIRQEASRNRTSKKKIWKWDVILHIFACATMQGSKPSRAGISVFTVLKFLFGGVPGRLKIIRITAKEIIYLDSRGLQEAWQDELDHIKSSAGASGDFAAIAGGARQG